MTNTAPPSSAPFFNGWRIAGWSMALALLALPAIAMQFTGEVDWTGTDFIFAAILIGALGIGMELAVRMGRSLPKRLGIAIASLAGFMTFWSNAAVGIIGDEGSPVNAGFFLLVIFAVIVSALVRLRPAPMKWLMVFMAAAQIALGIAATQMMPGHAVEWGILAFFAGMWSVAAGCFHLAASSSQAVNR